ncbi:hypothetical protein HYT95_02140 [Candidatus Peregrinibacteria bacterium]|nr:hypothetical protein [Candidatus Peregrinibacteria bacterium]
MLKRHLYERYIVPEKDWELLSEEERGCINAKKHTLDQWVEYLTSADTRFYPDWLKYLAIRSVLSMGPYDQKRAEFSKRSEKTRESFPELHPEALNIVLNVFLQKTRGERISLQTASAAIDGGGGRITGINDGKWLANALHGNLPSFSRLYGFVLSKMQNPIPERLLKITHGGRWEEFHRPLNYLPITHYTPEQIDQYTAPLREMARRYWTGWCIRKTHHAAHYLLCCPRLLVYCSPDEKGSPVVPRAIIVMRKKKDDGTEYIAEVRGVADGENLDPYILDVVVKKIEDLPGHEKYAPIIGNTRLLNTIWRKAQRRETLTDDDCRFLAQENIEFFGQVEDPRTSQLREYAGLILKRAE